MSDATSEDDLIDSPQENEVLGVAIIVGDRPFVIWDVDFPVSQLQFLKNLDPSYFEYQCRIHESQLGGPDDVQAAVALRMLYSHALECLFSLISAAIQAPFCPAGWLLKYQNADLERIVRWIEEREAFDNQLGLERIGWTEVATKLVPWLSPTAEQQDYIAGSRRFWRSLAQGFLDTHLQDEYNGLKHGLRVHPGGWQLAIGREDTPGVPAPAERMRLVAKSSYGSSFLRPILVKKYQYELEDQRVNWNPQDFLKRMPLIVASIRNVLEYLKLTNGESLKQIEFRLFTEAQAQEALSPTDHASSARLSLRPSLRAGLIPNVTADDIRSTYRAVQKSTDEQTTAPN